MRFHGIGTVWTSLAKGTVGLMCVSGPGLGVHYGPDLEWVGPGLGHDHVGPI